VGRHNNPYWGTALQQASGLKDRTIAPELAPEIVPVVIVDDIRQSLDPNQYPAVMGVTLVFTSTAGTLGFAYVLNPRSSQFVIEMESVHIDADSGAANPISLRAGPAGVGNNPTAGTNFAATRLNSGFEPVAAGGAVCTQGANAAGDGSSFAFDWRRQVAATGYAADVDLRGMVLQPGMWCGVQHLLALAATDHVSFRWKERPRVRG
jgi:hypothetical protein